MINIIDILMAAGSILNAEIENSGKFDLLIKISTKDR